MADLKIFCDGIEQEALDQINNLAACEAYKDAKIRIMPDSHAGIGCTIGTTMTVKDKLTPNLVGVDIGCGMLVAELGKVTVDPARLEEVITSGVPSGKNVREEEIPETQEALALVDALRCNPGRRAYQGLSIGTLGGGNHFIELDQDDEGNVYLVIHTGSRNLGTRVCFYYQELADKECAGLGKQAVAEMIAKLKAEGRAGEIQAMLKSLPKEDPASSKDSLAHLEGQNFEDYIHDMDLCQKYAVLNRHAIARIILSGLGLTPVRTWETIHNYIDIEHMILRKGAISAQAGERVIIPMNMRDGSLICIGKGNPDWNFSAPHGAGRLMSRAAAVERIDMEEFRRDMEGISTWSVCEETKDEAPGVYKPMESIITQIAPTASIERIIRPVYNYKAH